MKIRRLGPAAARNFQKRDPAMETANEWGYDVILWAQQFSPQLDALFKAITTLGAEQAFLFILPLIFWCWDKRRGARLGVLLMLSAYVNLTLKQLFDQPRPTPDRVEVLADETSPGIPSGHAQNAVVVYGYLAAQIAWPWAWVAAGLIAFAVGVSRIYLGVHFPSDVLGGWLIGGVVLALYLRAEPEVEVRLRPWPWNAKMALAVVVPLALFLTTPNENTAQLMGVMLGLTTGFLAELRWVRFSAGGPLWQRTLRFVVGVAVLIVVWLGLKLIFPSEPETLARVFRLLRYALVGMWASLGAPWLFVNTGLAPRESEAWE
jgi:membrane-associated phospholipid phosphatase